MTRTLLSIGEAMIEMSLGEGGAWRMAFAGDTLNTAWYARRLLPPEWRVAYLTALGTDPYSDAMRSFIAGSGIATDHVGTVTDRTAGLYFIHQDGGDRHFTYWRDRSAARLLARDRAALRGAIEAADAIYFSGITLAILPPDDRAAMLDMLAAARSRGARIAFDPNARRRLWPDDSAMRDGIVAGARVADIVLPTFSDERETFGDASPQATAARYLALGAMEVAVKNGARPAVVRAGDAAIEIAPPSAVEPVDATGAGDSFNGAYLAARFEGVEVAEAVLRAHRVAAVCIGHRGAILPPGPADDLPRIAAG